MDSPHKLNSSDASLLSSLVEDSSIQENTLVDSYWGTTLETVFRYLSVYIWSILKGFSSFLFECDVPGLDHDMDPKGQL